MTTKVKTTAAKSIEDVAAQAKEAVEGIMKASQEQATKQFEQTMAVTKEQVEKASQQIFKGYGELASFSKQNVDAFMQSSAIFTKGFEDFGKAAFAFAQSNLEQSVAAGKAMLTVKTVRELVDVQSEYAKSSFDSLMSESSKLSELSVKITNEALAPINARVHAAVEKLSAPIAA